MTIAPERPTAEATPESQNLAQLREMLADPDYAAWVPMISDSIRKLTANAILEA